MSIDELQKVINSMAPEDAATSISKIMKKLLPLLNEEARLKFVMDLAGDSGDDKVASLVHL